MTKYTPAPWTVREVSGLSIPGQRAFAIDFNEDQEQVVDWVYEEADAHLIAASPNMFEALNDCRRALELANFTEELAIVDAAIAKARGEA